MQYGFTPPSPWPADAVGPAVQSRLAAAYQATVKPLDSLAKVSLRTNAEMASLLSQRAQAYMAVPAQLAAARTAQDIMSAQMRFWQTAMNQYMSASQQMTAAWSSLIGATAAPLPQASERSTGLPLMDAWLAMMTGPFMPVGEQAREAPVYRYQPRRDFITFAEPQAPGSALTANDAPDRRAA